MENQSNNEYLSYDELSKVLGLPKGTLYSLVSRNQIPHIRISKRLVRFPKAKINEWLKACSIEPGAGGAA